MRALFAAAVALALTGCSSIPAGLTKNVIDQYGDRCTSHFWGNTGLGATAGFDVSCKPVVKPPAADTPKS